MAGKELARRILSCRVQAGGFDRHLRHVEITGAGEGKLVAEMKVQEEHCAPQLTFMHGAMSTLLVDSLSGIALMTANPKLQNAGVSLNIDMTFMKAAAVGEEILIHAAVDKVGSKIAFLSVEILSKATKELLAKGSHVKFIGAALNPVKEGNKK